MLISLSGYILGREALDWLVDMSAIGAAIGCGSTCLATIRTMKRDDGTIFFIGATVNA